MRILKFASRFPEPEPLSSERVTLQRPTLLDFEDWSALRRRSANFLQPFEPRWTHDELSRAAFKARLRRQEAEISSGRGLPWFLFSRTKDPLLLGGLTVSNIRRGVSETGTLGYWMGEEFAGQGYMKEALLVVCQSLFETHNLHRIEAATVLENERSQSLLLRCGFRQEGVARRYLKINGSWRDHLLFARLADDKLPEDQSKFSQ